MGYRILEHTSDLYIEGEGERLEKALEELAKGMFKSMGSAKSEKEKLIITYKGYDLELLIIGLFSKIISECEAESFVPKSMKVVELDKEKKEIEVEIRGGKGILENIIKAVTYNSFEIKEEKGVKVRILFDI